MLTPAQLSVSYWLAQTADVDKPLLSQAQIQQFNAQLRRQSLDVTDLFAEPVALSKAQITKMLHSVSQQASSERFYPDGQALTTADWQRYQQLLATEQINALAQVPYALVTRRGAIRSFPTLDRVLNSGMDINIDRFQETAVFPGQALRVLHYSRDRQWALVQHYHYTGWLQVTQFALTDKATAQNFVNAADFVLVTGAMVRTNYTNINPDVSEVELDMGVRLPRLQQHPVLVNGQNAAFSYVVQLPVRQADGSLQLIPSLIGRNQDLAEDYLPLTRGNILRQAFKFLGERYGWGHDYNARDCSGFVGEIYRSFGFELPRNTSALGQQSFGAEQQLTDKTAAEKIMLLQQAKVGDLLFIPGHVMLVLGQQQGETFVIHDVAGLSYLQPDGQYYQSALNGVSITPFSPLRVSVEQTYLDRLYNIKALSRSVYADR